MLVEISDKNQSRLTRVMDLTNFLYHYTFRLNSNDEDVNWINQILSYLQEDISSIHDEIDKFT